MKKFLAVFLTITVIFSFAAFAVGSSSDNDNAKVTDGDGTSTEDTTTENGNLRVNVGEVLETNKVKITYVSTGEYTDYGYSEPKNGYKVVFVELKAENTGSDDILVSNVQFECYADNEAMDKYWGDYNDELSAELSAGRTTTGRVYFEVPEDAESIEFEYGPSFWGNKKATFVVK